MEQYEQGPGIPGATGRFQNSIDTIAKSAQCEMHAANDLGECSMKPS